jgi:cysteine sulfinate desulfinase/cysteine desulfurase-like protein
LKEKSSYVIDSLGHDEGLSKSSIRFTFGRSTNKKAIDYVIKSLVEICNPIIEI